MNYLTYIMVQNKCDYMKMCKAFANPFRRPLDAVVNERASILPWISRLWQVLVVEKILPSQVQYHFKWYCETSGYCGQVVL